MTKDGRGLWVPLRDRETNQRLELNWYAKASEFDLPCSAAEGLDHIGFEVLAAPDAHRRLVSLGAKPTVVTPETTDGWQAHVEDPDGN